MHPGTTVVEHILESQRHISGSTGAFTMLLNEMIVAAKYINRELNQTGLSTSAALSAREPVERMRRLEHTAREILVSRLISSGQAAGLISNEAADLLELTDGRTRGNYLVAFDPLDSASNVVANVSVGTIFSIYRLPGNQEEMASADFLQAGRSQAAAGYFLYGSSTMMVYTTGQGVHGFTLDPEVGEFLLSHENIRIPSSGKIYSVNEGHRHYWDEPVRSFVDSLKAPDKQGRTYSSRYVGGLVADFHRNLLAGGVFLHSAEHRDNKPPSARLRLMTEANPLAMVVEQAGGRASNGREAILDIIPEDINQRVPLIIGSSEEVLRAEELFRNCPALAAL